MAPPRLPVKQICNTDVPQASDRCEGTSATLNHKQRRHRAANSVLQAMIERWPRCFYANPAKRRPFKIGIHREIMALGIWSRRAIDDAFAGYCGRPAYLRNLVEGAHRVDLDGADAGIVTAEEATTAKEHLRQFLINKRKFFQARADNAAWQARRERVAHKVVAPPPSKRAGLADLKAAALARRNEGHALSRPTNTEINLKAPL